MDTIQTTIVTPQIHYLGIDIAKDKFDVALTIKAAPNDLKGKDRHKAKVFTNNPEGFGKLFDWLQAQGVHSEHHTVHCAMEATGVYGEALAQAIVDRGLRVSVVNPSQIASYAKSLLSRGKTDKQDARIIARYCEHERPATWVAAPLAQRALLALVRQHHHLKDSLQAEDNRLQTAPSIVQDSIKQVMQAITLEIACVEKMIKAHLDQHPEMKHNEALLRTIPGIGEKTAVWLLAYLGDGQRFGRGKQAAAFAGLTPSEYVSGSSVHKRTRVSKAGHTDLRAIMFMPALSAYGRHPKYEAFVGRLKAAGKAPKAIVVALMRKMLTIAQAVLRSQTPFNPAFHAA